MSGKLDQSLDQIMKDSGTTAGRRGRGPRRAATKAKAAIAAPTNGVLKNTKSAPAGRKGATMAAPEKLTPTGPAGEGKIIISGLPVDVMEPMLKDYFQKLVGGCKRAIVTYGPQGISRGVATVVFTNMQLATEAARLTDGTTIDNKKWKVEVIQTVPAKTLSDRVSKPKSAAKDAKPAAKGGKAAAPTPATNGAKKAAGGKKVPRANRPKKKTADELDAEMMDYFGNENTNTNGAAQPAAATSSEPVDQIM